MLTSLRVVTIHGLSAHEHVLRNHTRNLYKSVLKRKSKDVHLLSYPSSWLLPTHDYGAPSGHLYRCDVLMKLMVLIYFAPKMTNILLSTNNSGLLPVRSISVIISQLSSCWPKIFEVLCFWTWRTHILYPWPATARNLPDLISPLKGQSNAPQVVCFGS